MPKAKPTHPARSVRRQATTRRPWAGAFLADLRANGVVSYAARAAGIDRGTAYDLRERDPEFAEEWDDAIEEATDSLEGEARRRALDGFDEITTERDEEGREVVTKRIRRYSDSLLMFLLRANRRKFRGDAAEINVTVGSADPEAARAAILAAGEAAARKHRGTQ